MGMIKAAAVPLICSIVLFSGCASAPEPLPPMPAAPQKVVLAPGNQIEIKFAYSQQFNELQTIRADGKIEMHFVGEVMAAGKTPEELRDELMRILAEHLKYPQLSVFVRATTDNRVYVGGEVKTPGLVDMQGRLTALEAIVQAGGFKPESAGASRVVVMRQRDGQYQRIALNLDETLSGDSAAAFYLESHDVVVVPQSGITRIDQWIDQYINRLIPYIGFNIVKTNGNTTWGYNTSR